MLRKVWGFPALVTGHRLLIGAMTPFLTKVLFFLLSLLLNMTAFIIGLELIGSYYITG